MRSSSRKPGNKPGRKPGRKSVPKEKRLSNIVRPSSLSSKEWQTVLRRQAAEKENLIVSRPDGEGQYGGLFGQESADPQRLQGCL